MLTRTTTGQSELKLTQISMPRKGHVRTILGVTVVSMVAAGSVRVGRRDEAGAEAHAVATLRAIHATLRAIHSAQDTFASSCTAGGYAD